MEIVLLTTSNGELFEAQNINTYQQLETYIESISNNKEEVRNFKIIYYSTAFAKEPGLLINDEKTFNFAKFRNSTNTLYLKLESIKTNLSDFDNFFDDSYIEPTHSLVFNREGNNKEFINTKSKIENDIDFTTKINEFNESLINSDFDCSIDLRCEGKISEFVVNDFKNKETLISKLNNLSIILPSNLTENINNEMKNINENRAIDIEYEKLITFGDQEKSSINNDLNNMKLFNEMEATIIPSVSQLMLSSPSDTLILNKQNKQMFPIQINVKNNSSSDVIDPIRFILLSKRDNIRLLYRNIEHIPANRSVICNLIMLIDNIQDKSSFNFQITTSFKNNSRLLNVNTVDFKAIII